MNENNIGGIASKLGNAYEAKWLILQLLDVVWGNAQSLRFEGITAPFAGFEAAVQRDAITEWHQTKINAPHGSWTVTSLEHEGVWSAVGSRLVQSSTDLCVFVSQDPARDVGAMTVKARRANDGSEFVDSLNKKEHEAFDRLRGIWDVDDTTMRCWLARCSFRTLPTSEIENQVNTIGALLLSGDGTYGALRTYLEERFNKLLTTETIRNDLRDYEGVSLKHWQLDPTLIERLRSETQGYLDSYGALSDSGNWIERRETTALVDLITQVNGPEIILVSGVAGAGKSGVVRGLIEKLGVTDIRHLAFRVDHHLDAHSTERLGQDLTGRNESPAVTLKGLSPDHPSVLIVDQVDAVSDASGRSGPAKSALLRLIREVEALASIKLVFVCRSFDLGSDAAFKQLQHIDKVAKLEIKPLDWEGDVEPLLSKSGIDTSSLSTKQRELLQLPLNLGLFIEIKGAAGSFASRNDLFSALLELKERATRQRGVSWSLTQPLGAVAEWMSERQRLDAPVSILTGFAGALDVLRSENLITVTRGRLGLFHESLFDHLYAQQFTTHSSSLASVLMGSEQHLFRRTQSRQILEALRQCDRPRYLKELRDVLFGANIRFHIKHAIAQWLGALADPTVEELRIVSALDKDDHHSLQLSNLALLGSTDWFDLLQKEGWIEKELRGNGDRQDRILRWLSLRLRERPDEVVALMRSWWHGDCRLGQELLRWISFVDGDAGGEPLTALCEEVIRTCGGDGPLGRQDMILSSWVGRRPKEGAHILRALADAWFEAHPDQHPFERDEVRNLDLYDLEEFAKKSPINFLEGASPMLVRSLTIINQREQTDQRDFTFSRPCPHGEVFGADKLISLYRRSLRHVASETPEEARRLLAALPPSVSAITLHLHLEAIAASNGALAKDLVPLLDFGVAEAGWQNAEWKSFADAATASLGYLSAGEKAVVERHILELRPELESAVELLKSIKERGPDSFVQPDYVIWKLSQSGKTRWAILETIGIDLLSPKAVAVLQEGRRKFRGCTVPSPSGIKVGWVKSPISRERVELMPDDDLIRAMKKYSTDDGKVHKLDFEGGARQLGGELQRLAKECPRRFAALIARIPDTANPTYVDHILWGLAEAEHADVSQLRNVIQFAQRRPGHHHEGAIARLFDRHPTVANDPALLESLLWLGQHGAANEDDAVDSSMTEREFVTIEDLIHQGSQLHIRGINGVRGAAAEALEKVIWHVPSSVEPAWQFMDQRIEEEPLVSVRCCLVKPLLPLFNSDKPRCAEALERLIANQPTLRREDKTGKDPSAAPLATYAATQLLPYIIGQVPDVGRRLVQPLLNSSNEAFRLLGAWHAIRASYTDASYADLADEVSQRGVGKRRLAAALAADAAVHDEFRDRAEAALIKYFDDPDQQTRSQAAGVFREIRELDFRHYRRLAEAYVSSQAFGAEAWAFLRLLENGTGNVQDLVVAAAERVVKGLAECGTAHGRHMSELHTLQDLIRRDYAVTENDEPLRKRLLAVIDALLAGGHYGSDAILKDHDRW